MSVKEPSVMPFSLLNNQYDNLRSCIRCGLCLSVCPIYQETIAEEESPRGRIAIARALTEGHLGVTRDLLRHEYSCLMCEACTAICPAGVLMEPIQISLREEVDPHVRRSWLERLARRLAFDYAFARMRNLRFVYRLLRVSSRWGVRAFFRACGVLRLIRLAKAEALLPARLPEPLVPQGQVWEPANGRADSRVALFTGCVMSTVLADTTRATAHVLAVNGWQVVAAAGQECCGALHGHSSLPEGAQDLARRNIDAFEKLEVDAIVVNSAGCGAFLKHYDRLLEGDPAYRERAKLFSAKVKDVLELLGSRELNPDMEPLDYTVTYQEPCHLAHAQGVRQAPRKLLRAIPGLKLVEMEESSLCCGSAGLYNLSQAKMSQELLERKLHHALATGAQVIASANPGCLLQLGAGLRQRRSLVRAVHIVDLLAEAYQKVASNQISLDLQGRVENRHGSTGSP